LQPDGRRLGDPDAGEKLRAAYERGDISAAQAGIFEDLE
jgi:hypothetical protein